MGIFAANYYHKITNIDESVIYGQWVEQGVASYAADSFEVRKGGIYIDGSLRTNHFDFNGKKLIYTVGNNTYLYLLKNNSLLIREKPFHYTSPFKKIPQPKARQRNNLVNK